MSQDLIIKDSVIKGLRASARAQLDKLEMLEKATREWPLSLQEQLDIGVARSVAIMKLETLCCALLGESNI